MEKLKCLFDVAVNDSFNSIFLFQATNRPEHNAKTFFSQWSRTSIETGKTFSIIHNLHKIKLLASTQDKEKWII